MKESNGTVLRLQPCSKAARLKRPAAKKKGRAKHVNAGKRGAADDLTPESVEKISAMIDSLCEMAKTVNAEAADD